MTAPTGKALREELSEALADTGNARWSADQLRGFINRAMTEAVMVRPDANARYQTVGPLAQGAEQSLDSLASEALVFMGGVRNMGSDGSTPGAAVTNADKATKDAIAPNWAVAKAESVVVDVVWDDHVARTFWVSPPVPSSPDVHLMIRVAREPTAVTDGNEDDPVDLPATYRQPIHLFALAHAYRLNTDAASKQLADNYYQQAMQLLGRQLQVLNASPPRSKGDSG